MTDSASTKCREPCISTPGALIHAPRPEKLGGSWDCDTTLSLLFRVARGNLSREVLRSRGPGLKTVFLQRVGRLADVAGLDSVCVWRHSNKRVHVTYPCSSLSSNSCRCRVNGLAIRHRNDVLLDR